MILLIGVLSTNNSLLKIAGAVFSIKRIHSFQSCIPTWLSNTIMKTQNCWRYFLVFLYPSAHKNKFLTLLDIKKPTTLLWVFFCGERGIRTPGGVTLNSFQDCRIRPLCHFSLRLCGCKYRNLFQL